MASEDVRISRTKTHYMQYHFTNSKNKDSNLVTIKENAISKKWLLRVFKFELLMGTEEDLIIEEPLNGCATRILCGGKILIRLKCQESISETYHALWYSFLKLLKEKMSIRWTYKK